MEQVVLKHAEKQSSTDPPFIAVFPAGMPTEIADKDDFTFKYLGSKDARKSNQGILFAETSQTRFVGLNVENENISRSQDNFAIGVFRPGKNTTRVIGAHGLFVVKQSKLADTVGLDTDTITTSDFQTVRTELTERFGSRKRRRELRSEENNKFSVENNASSELALTTALNTASDVLMTDAIPTSNDTAQDILLPRYDAATEESHLIYPFISFLPKGLWSGLDTDLLIKSKLTKDEMEGQYPSYVMLRLSRFHNLKGAEAHEVARQLLFMTYLLRLSKQRKCRSVAAALNCSPTIGDYIKQHYIPTGELTHENKTKLLCHATILALNTSVSQVMDGDALTCFASDCKLAVSQLLPYFIRIGAKASKSKCKLTAPLVLPQLMSATSSSRR